MTTTDVLMVLAVLLAPVVALQIGKVVEGAKERRDRKLNVFRTLMATRAARVSAEHVVALNMIDLEFVGRPKARNARVAHAWKAYRDNLNARDESPETWAARNNDLFIDLLFEISRVLGYGFDKVDLRRGVYSPQAHGEFEEDQRIIRKSLVKGLSGETPFSVQLISPDEEVARQHAMQEKLAANLDPNRVIRVQIENKPSAAAVFQPGDSAT